MPRTRSEYEACCAKIKATPSPKKWWFGQTYLYWSDCLDDAEENDFLKLKCPILVISGSADIQAKSTQRLVEKARNQGVDLVHFCIEGLGHNNQIKYKDEIMKKLSTSCLLLSIKVRTPNYLRSLIDSCRSFKWEG